VKIQKWFLSTRWGNALLGFPKSVKNEKDRKFCEEIQIVN
jgi:hypothetical protein